jgi:hypothetical protein
MNERQPTNAPATQERREPANIADVVALRLVAEAPYIHLVDETLA